MVYFYTVDGSRAEYSETIAADIQTEVIGSVCKHVETQAANLNISVVTRPAK